MSALEIQESNSYDLIISYEAPLPKGLTSEEVASFATMTLTPLLEGEVMKIDANGDHGIEEPPGHGRTLGIS